MNPKVDRERFLVRELADETLVYDLRRHRAHCLNATAAIVWSACDGRTSKAVIAGLLARRLGAPADEAVVDLALARLSRAGLVKVAHASAVRPPRRAVLKALGLLLPAVYSITAPTPAAAATACTEATCISFQAPLGCCCADANPRPKLCRQTGATRQCNGDNC